MQIAAPGGNRPAHAALSDDPAAGRSGQAPGHTSESEAAAHEASAAHPAHRAAAHTSDASTPAPGETLRRLARDPRPAGAEERQGAVAATAGARAAGSFAIQGHASADAAARAALERANPMSVQNNLEFGGKVFQHQGSGRYSASLPRAGTDQGFDPTKVSEPAGQRWVGDYHTHGDYSEVGEQGEAVRTSDPQRDEFNSNRFSRQDLRGIAADAQGRPGYTGYLGTPGGDFRRFDPALRADTVFARQPGEAQATAHTLRGGALAGGAVQAGQHLVRALGDGQIDAREARQIGSGGAQGALLGGGYALTERALTRSLDRHTGIAIEHAAARAATRSGAADAGALGAAARSGLTRLGGAGAAGALLSAGLSAYAHRADLARGDARAIGQVAGDTVVGTSAALSGAAAGAAVGSVVPGLGTAVGALVGLGVGLATDHLLRAAGVDRAVGEAVRHGLASPQSR